MVRMCLAFANPAKPTGLNHARNDDFTQNDFESSYIHRLPSIVEMISLRGHQVIILALVISAMAAVMGAVKRKHFPIGWWRKTF